MFSGKVQFYIDETLKEIAIDILDIIEFFDSMHKEQIEELVNPVVAEATE